MKPGRLQLVRPYVQRQARQLGAPADGIRTVFHVAVCLLAHFQRRGGITLRAAHEFTPALQFGSNHKFFAYMTGLNRNYTQETWGLPHG